VSDDLEALAGKDAALAKAPELESELKFSSSTAVTAPIQPSISGASRRRANVSHLLDVLG